VVDAARGGHAFAGLDFMIDDRDARTLARQQTRGRAANRTGTTGDHSYPARKLHVALPSWCAAKHQGWLRIQWA